MNVQSSQKRKREPALDESEGMSSKSVSIHEETPISEDNQSVVSQNKENVKVLHFMGGTPTKSKRKKKSTKARYTLRIPMSSFSGLCLPMWYDNPHDLVHLFVSLEP